MLLNAFLREILNFLKSVFYPFSNRLFVTPLYIKTTRRFMEQVNVHQMKDPSMSKDNGARVLVVDDDKINQFVIRKHLNKWGFEVVIASSGMEALALIESKEFQMVLMDLNMPEMDGAEVTKRIRAMQDPYFKTVPILAYSAIIDNKEKAIKLGMTDYASKPVNPVELQSKMVKYITETKMEPGSRKLSIDFDVYTQGDIEFKHELISLMIQNLMELDEAMQRGGIQNNPDLFSKSIHKVSPTIGMINDQEFSTVVEILKETEINSEAFDARREQFHSLCQSIIQGLENEKAADRGELSFVSAA
jgi:CheY-like chemotaxis protein